MFFLFGCCGVHKTPSSFPLNVLGVPFGLIEYILTTAKIKFRCSISCLSHRPYRGSELMLWSEGHLQKFLKSILFKRGQGEHILTIANLKLKPSLFTPCPSVYTLLSLSNIISLSTYIILLRICISKVYINVMPYSNQNLAVS